MKRPPTSSTCTSYRDDIGSGTRGKSAPATVLVHRLGNDFYGEVVQCEHFVDRGFCSHLHRGVYVFRCMPQLDNQPQGCSCRDLSRLLLRSCNKDDCDNTDHDTIENIAMDSASLN